MAYRAFCMQYSVDFAIARRIHERFCCARVARWHSNFLWCTKCRIDHQTRECERTLNFFLLSNCITCELYRRIHHDSELSWHKSTQEKVDFWDLFFSGENTIELFRDISWLKSKCNRYLLFWKSQKLCIIFPIVKLFL